MRIRVGDTVQVIAGNHRGDRGKVLKINRETGRVVVEGVNLGIKHVRKTQKNPQGGRLRKELPLSLSNVMLVCGACGAATRVGARILKDKTKERYCKKCDKGMGQITTARTKTAKKK